MKTPDPDCESRYEVQLEQRAEGLSLREAEELAGHLLHCVGCRQYERQMEVMQAIIQTDNAAVKSGGLWERTKARVERKERERVRKLVRQLSIMLVAAVMTSFCYIDGRTLSTSIGALTGAVLPIICWRYRARKEGSAANSLREIGLIMKETFASRTWSTKGGLFVLLLLMLACLGNMLETPPGWLPDLWPGDGNGRRSWMFIFLVPSATALVASKLLPTMHKRFDLE